MRTIRPDDRARQGWRTQLFPVNGDIALNTMLGIWAGNLAYGVLRSVPFASTDFSRLLGQYLLMTLVSLGATWLLYRLIILAGDNRISRIIMILFTVPTMTFALALSFISGAVISDSSAMPGLRIEAGDWVLIDGALIPYLLLVLWGAVYLALSRDRAMRTAIENGKMLRKVTQESELRALRYQLNPHFMFNALNSVSGLIIDQKNQQAEKLVDDLSDYMRVVLNDNGEPMITVAEEIAQQLRYLEIEQVRFPERLHLDVHIDEAVANWQIPALIIQPLVENAIKYGVSRSADPVTIKLSATKEDNRLRLSVANTGRMIFGHNDHAGTGTGLANVGERLALVYGSSAALVTANTENGMAIATIILPEKGQMLQIP